MKNKLVNRNGKSAEKPSKTRRKYNHELIAELSMAIGMNKIESLKIFDDDDINSKVDAFTKKHKLGKKQKLLIIDEINNQISKKKKTERSISQTTIRPKQEIERIDPNSNLNVITKKFLGIEKPHRKLLKGKSINREDDESKLTKYNYMFQKLDSDNDGKISAQKINLCVLDFDILEAMTPILKELQKEQKTMGFKDFCARADKCFEK